MPLGTTTQNSRDTAVQELADQLGLSRSQVIDEALALLRNAVSEVRRGRRVVAQDPRDLRVVSDLTPPTLTAIEWAFSPKKLELSDEELVKMQEIVDARAEPGARLRAAAKRYRH